MGLPRLHPRIERPSRRSDALAERAGSVFPGGVNHAPRALRTVGEWPRVFARGEGAHLFDADGSAWLDLSMAAGAALLGHAAPGITAAATRALSRGAHFDAPSEEEVRLGEALTRWVPGMERVRLTVTAGEAVALAVRLARAFTGRAGILKMEGHAHGGADALQRQALARPGGGGLVEAAGIPEGALRETFVVPYNDTDAVRSFLRRHPGQVAALILEPVATRMGVVPPRAGYLRSVREFALEHGALLVFDETSTGLRVGRGGAQEFFGVRADLTVLGKVLGGGLPAGALGGRAEILALLAPSGPVHAGEEFAGYPPAAAAGLAMLEALEDERAYGELEARGALLEAGLARAAAEAGVAARVQRVGSMLSLFFTESQVCTWADAARCDTRRHAAWAEGMAARGVHLPASQYEPLFLSLAHTREDLELAADLALESLLDGRP